MANKIKNFRKGHVKKTQMQNKKHVSQMSDYELKGLEFMLSNIFRLERTSHLIDKIENKEVILDMNKVYETLHRWDIQDNILEYNETYSDYTNRVEQRVLIRLSSQRMVNIKGRGRIRCNTFVVINLTTKQVVTSYLNEHDDLHESINMGRYSDKLKVRGIRKGGYKLHEWQDCR